MNYEDFENYVLPTYERQKVNFVKGNNATLWDDTGKEYIDFSAGVAVCSIGHGNKILAKDIAHQASKIIHVSNNYYIEPQGECAKHLVKLSGYDMKCFFCNSGTEANEGAIKIARKHGELKGDQKRYKIITLVNSFHGRTITALKATGQTEKHNYFGPFPEGFIYAKDIDEVPSLLDESTIAVMIELIQGEGGMETLNKKKVQNLAELLKKREILLIVDEVQTGIYRTGHFLASHAYGITPDIITLAKGLGGGIPIGVVMTRLKNIFSFGDHGSTFGGNYLSTTAANTTLVILNRYAQSGLMKEIQDYFDNSLQIFASKYPTVFIKCVGIKMMQGLRVTDEKSLTHIVNTSIKMGVLIIKSGKNTLRFLPPLTITKEEIDKGFSRLSFVLDEYISENACQ
ncbi:MAG: aminotransferase class III-fold pyridoxal phosphate-dependent enzyme [Sulfurimonas sp.]|jgi:acetylornithine aminotransferase|nr:aminotransferase class III-fold pyridoxal phosphate-dependent enzyme [Sulfurimonas sp.]